MMTFDKKVESYEDAYEWLKTYFAEKDMGDQTENCRNVLEIVEELVKDYPCNSCQFSDMG